MNEANLPAPGKSSRVFPLLERITGLVLVAVLLVLGWMVVAANAPSADHLLPVAVEVALVIALLAAALLLVSVVALAQTRGGPTVSPRA